MKRRTSPPPARPLALTALVVATLLTNPARDAVAGSSLTGETMVAFTSGDLFALDDGRTLSRLGTLRERIYLIGSLRPYGDVVRLPAGFVARQAALSPRGDLVAFAGSSGRTELDRLVGIFVADTTGTVVASFPGAVCYSWDARGRRLAVSYSPTDSGQTDPPLGVVVWDAATARTTSYLNSGDAIAWHGDDTLLISRSWGVGALCVSSRKTVRTAHRSVRVSPDGRFSIGKMGAPPQVWEDAAGVERLACCWRALDHALAADHRLGEAAMSGPTDQGGEIIEYATVAIPPGPDPPQVRILSSLVHPFWIGATGASHLLVVGSNYHGTDRYGNTIAGPQRAVVLDVDAGEVLATFEGRAIGMTADQRGILVLRSDDNLAIEDVVPIAQEAARRAAPPSRARGPSTDVTVKSVRVDRWRGFEDRVSLGSGTFHVRTGDWLPGFIPGHGPCDRDFKVEEVLPSGRAVISFDPAQYARILRAGRELAASDWARGRIEIGESDLVLVLKPPISRWERESRTRPSDTPLEITLRLAW